MPVTYEPIPQTYQEAFERIYTGLSDEEKAFIRSQDNPAVIHFTVGMGMRNAWNLWGAQPGVSTALRDEFVSRFKLGHADDMSGFLLSAVWAKVHGEPFDEQAEIRRYHEHWAKAGIDPVTQEKTD